MYVPALPIKCQTFIKICILIWLSSSEFYIKFLVLSSENSIKFQVSNVRIAFFYCSKTFNIGEF